MKAYRLPAHCAAILFDMDSTLYTHPEYQRIQQELPVERLALIKGKSVEEMNREIAGCRKAWAAAHSGQNLSLGNVFKTFGVSIEESVRWREELYQPERYLSENRRLCVVLEDLAARFSLAVVTNNPVSIAVRTLSALGVAGIFEAIVGLDTCGVSKPHAAPFCKAAELCGAAPASCVSVGDRYDIDIALPLELGMGGILVDGVEDVYKLPDLFGKR
jgi:phosphoglycolate phosphatase/putative hydrolase of the HAD superfamily